MEGSAAVGPKVVMPPLLSAIEDHLPLLLRAAVTTAGATVTGPHAATMHLACMLPSWCASQVVSTTQRHNLSELMSLTH